MRKLLLDNVDTWKKEPIFDLFRDILFDNFTKTKNGDEQLKFFTKYKPEKILDILHKYNPDMFDVNPKQKEGNFTEKYLINMLDLAGINSTLLFRFEQKLGIKKTDEIYESLHR